MTSRVYPSLRTYRVFSGKMTKGYFKVATRQKMVVSAELIENRLII